jgi:hypothetical protein
MIDGFSRHYELLDEKKPMVWAENVEVNQIIAVVELKESLHHLSIFSNS